MQKSTLTIKNKTNLLLVLALAIILISIPIGLDNIDSSKIVYYAIHVVSVIFGLFLSLIGIITFLEFRNTRLLMVFSAFVAITVAESVSLINFIYPFFQSTYSIHDYITHGLIFIMLTFFVIGIFRSD